jgi:hypothetical protein
MADATYSIGLVVEAPADERTVTTLVDRCVCEGIEWVEPEILGHFRSWRGIEPGTGLTEWKHVKALATTHRVTTRGFFDGDPGKEDARAGRKALLLFRKFGMPDFVLLVRDADKSTRKAGLEQARKVSLEAEHVVIGVANPEREAWVLGAFVPCDERERRSIASERQRLGFDPTLTPHELGGNGKRSAKTAHANLLLDDHDREHLCLTEPPLEHLRERGQHTGLAAFLDEIDERIVTVVSGQQRR